MLTGVYKGKEDESGFKKDNVYNIEGLALDNMIYVVSENGYRCGYATLDLLWKDWKFTKDESSDKPLATYEMRATGKDSTGYYYTDWKRATPIKVRATSKKEAIKKAEQALGTPPRLSDMWAITVDSIVVD